MKKFFFKSFLSLCLIFTLLLPNIVFASSENVFSTPPGSNTDITIYGTGKPTEFIDLSTYTGLLNFAGTAENSILYLNKGFTNASTVTISVYNKSASTLTVHCYRNELIDVKVDTHTVSSGIWSTYSITGLSTNKEYFLAFVAPSDFEGYLL